MSSGRNKIFLDEDTLLVTAPIGELSALELEADARDMLSLEGVTSPKRRAERLAWRRLLRETAGRDVVIEYECSGAPRIDNSLYKHISVSHCRDRVALLLSAEPCGVDIERRDRDFAVVAERYLSPQELTLCGAISREDAFALMWSAKECIYKFLRRAGVDLRADIHITHVDPEQASILARVDVCATSDQEPTPQTLTLGYSQSAEHTLVWLTTKKESPLRE